MNKLVPCFQMLVGSSLHFYDLSYVNFTGFQIVESIHRTWP
jgi:hypothetical protein